VAKANKMELSRHYLSIIKSIPYLLGTAKIPLPIVAMHDGISEQTVRKNYPLVRISAKRQAVPLDYLRRERGWPGGEVSKTA
jgi:hypothetical protein